MGWYLLSVWDIFSASVLVWVIWKQNLPCLMSAFLLSFVRNQMMKSPLLCCLLLLLAERCNSCLGRIDLRDEERLHKILEEGSLLLVFPGRSRTRTVLWLLFFSRYKGRKEWARISISLLCNLLDWIYDTLLSEVGNLNEAWNGRMGDDQQLLLLWLLRKMTSHAGCSLCSVRELSRLLTSQQ